METGVITLSTENYKQLVENSIRLGLITEHMVSVSKEDYISTSDKFILSVLGIKNNVED